MASGRRNRDRAFAAIGLLACACHLDDPAGARTAAEMLSDLRLHSEHAGPLGEAIDLCREWERTDWYPALRARLDELIRAEPGAMQTGDAAGGN